MDAMNNTYKIIYKIPDANDAFLRTGIRKRFC